MPFTWELRPEDQQLFERELDDFIPDRVYDMHAHLWRARDWEGNPPGIVLAAPPEITLERYKEFIRWILPRREVHGFHFAYPTVFPNDTALPNAWVAQEITKDTLSRGQFYVRPTDDPEWVRSEVKRLGMRGFKPFVGFLDRPDKNMAEIAEFCPEWIFCLAHEEHWSITLHMQRPRSLADESNLHWITTFCKRFPNMTLILDHCARGFSPFHLIEGLEKLGRLPNLYVDTSAICNPLAVIACIHYLGIDHVLFASDFYCSHLRGTNLPVGDSFLWLLEDSNIWKDVSYEKPPVLLGLENLRAIKAAFRVLKLSDNDVEKFFWSNGAQLLDLH